MLRHWTKIGLVALAVLSAGSALAMPRLSGVEIQRALGGQSVTVRFESTEARTVELRVNGMSVGTRAVNGTMTNTVDFRVDQAMLNDGDNAVEAVIYDGSGNVISVQKSTVEMDAAVESPVIITQPKAGQTVQGLVEIRVQVRDAVRPKMVAFIVNGDTRSMTNVAPYTYVIDTEMLSNGWHDVQVLVVDDANVSFRSRRVRVFVNNPGGRTERVMPVAVPAPTVVAAPVAPVMAAMSGAMAARPARPSTVKPMNVATPKAVVNGTRSLTPTGRRNIAPKAAPVAPRPTTAKPATAPAAKAPVAKAPTRPAQTRPVLPNPVTTVARPTTRPVVAKPAPVNSVTTTAQTVRIAYGTRLNLTGPLTLTYNARVLNMDVQPRVTRGVALSPFRHLYEAAGGKVKWENAQKTVTAKGAASEAVIRVGSSSALLDGQRMRLEYAAFIERGRTIVPLSFISDVLKVNVDVDTKTGHVLITNRK